MPIVNLHITRGADGLQLALAVRDNANGRLLPKTQQHRCALPSLPAQLDSVTRSWHQSYTNWLNGVVTLTGSSPPIEIETNISVSRECQQLGERLIREFNSWIGHSHKIQVALSQIVPKSDYERNPNDFCFVLHTDTGDPELDLTLQRLPFHTWDFLQEFYPHAEMALSTTSHSVPPATIGQRPQVLVILGDDPKIDFSPHQQAIGQNLVDSQLADVRYWSCTPGSPHTGLKSNLGAIPDLIVTLRESSPQVIIFIGHSQSTHNASASGLRSDAPIQIWLNESEYISPQDPNFQKILRGLRDRGLIFAAFISCDGLGIARELNDLGIPYLLVSREILPVHVAKNFLDEFLAKATAPGVPIHIALSYARQHLQDTVETSKLSGCPNASTFPAIFQIPEQHSYILNPIDDRDPIVKTEASRPQQRYLKYLLVLSLSFICVFLLHQSLQFRPSICEFAIETAGISCGEKSLLNYPESRISDDKQKGFNLIGKALKNPNLYHEAIETLKRDWERNHDPETAIAIENAKLANLRSPVKIKNIAVVIPVTDTPTYIADSLLKGVAYVQQQTNQNSKLDWGLRVLIADDKNDPTTAAEIARKLVSRDDILAVIGHYSSEVTVPIKKIYQDNKTVLISPTATSDRLTDRTVGNYFFRVVPENSIFAKDIITKWINPTQKIALFYQPHKQFSKSLTDKFKEEITKKYPNTTIFVKEFDLDKPDRIEDNIKQAQQLGANTIVLFPDAHTGDRNTNSKSEEVLKYTNGMMPILANTSIYDLYDNDTKGGTIPVRSKLYENVTMSVPWDYSNSQKYPGGLFAKQVAKNLPDIPQWWLHKKQQSVNSLNERIAMSYDAALVIAEALERATDRLTVQQAITHKHFYVDGITGRISFQGSDRKEKFNSLLVPDCKNNECIGLKPWHQHN